MAVVVSTWHLIEIAHTTNIANAVALAEFMDSLNPGWLLERHDLKKLEVEEDFCRFSGCMFLIDLVSEHPAADCCIERAEKITKIRYPVPKIRPPVD